MKKFCLLSVILILSFVILGCPYKSNVAIDNYAKTKADKRIFGYWITKDTLNTDAKVTSYYSVNDRNGYVFDIEKYTFNDTNVKDDEISEAEDGAVIPDTAEISDYNREDEEYIEPSGIFEVSESYEAFFSEIDGMKFLNVRQMDDFSGFGYYIYRITFKGNYEFVLSPLTDYIKTKFKSSDELKNYIKKYKELEFFYGDNEHYLKYELPK